MKNSLSKIIPLCALAVLLFPLLITLGQGGNTLTWDYDATGDTFANFANTLSFAADTNNGRAVISKRRTPRENSPFAWRLRSETAGTTGNTIQLHQF